MQGIQDISEEETNSLTQSILKRYGIDFTCYESKSLRRRIIRLMNILNIASIYELWVRFLKDPEFIHVFMDEMSVGMTSMFRDPVLWKNLKKKLALEYRSKDSLSIWHAGCSTGEEVYSMGVVLRETFLQEKAKALATDLNKTAIEEARNGIYHKIKMIENETNHRAYNPVSDFSKYYTSDGLHATMDPGLIKHASFQYHNLITDSYPTGFDFVLCRNVMIYFDTATKVKLLHKFHSALKDNGYLIIGFFDTMGYLMDANKFRLVDEEAKIFQKVS
jgi:chemotaxis protein methyltransferase CheR